MPFSWPLAPRGFVWALALGAGALLLGGAVAACGTDAEGVDSCRILESARCDRANGCAISLAKPAHEGAPDRDVSACKRFYHDACLHGLVSQTDPGAIEVEACRVAIESGTCDVVKEPALDPACYFLTETPPVVDAGSDADAGDASTGLDELLGDASPF